MSKRDKQVNVSQGQGEEDQELEFREGERQETKIEIDRKVFFWQAVGC